MDITSNQFITALDSYMKENGGGPKYFAKRMAALFDEKNAPLNPKGALAKVIDNLSISSSSVNDVVKEFKKSVTPFIGKLDSFGKIIPELMKAVQSFEENLKSTNIKKGKPQKSNSGQTSNNVNLFTKDKLERFHRFFVEKPLPVQIMSISPEALRILDMASKKEKLFSSGEPDSDKKTGVFSKIKNYLYSELNHQPKEKQKTSSTTGLLGSILSLGGTVLGAMVLLPYIDKFLNETEAGKKIKIFASKLVSRVGNAILSDIVMPFFGWLKEKILGVDIWPLLSVWLLARFTPVVGGVVKMLEKVVLQGAKMLARGLWTSMRPPSAGPRGVGGTPTPSTPSSSRRTGRVSRPPLASPRRRPPPLPKPSMLGKITEPLGRAISKIGPALATVGPALAGSFSRLLPALAAAAGPALVVAGIITAGYIAVTKIKESFDIVKNIGSTIKEMREVEQKNYTSFAKFYEKRSKKIDDEYTQLIEKQKKGISTPVDDLRVKELDIEKKLGDEQKKQKEIASREVKWWQDNSVERQKNADLRNSFDKIAKLREEQTLIKKQKEMEQTTPLDKKDEIVKPTSQKVTGLMDKKVEMLKLNRISDITKSMKGEGEGRTFQELQAEVDTYQSISYKISDTMKSINFGEMTITSPKIDATTPLKLEGSQSEIALRHHQVMESKFDIFTELLSTNIQATIQSGGQIANTVASTAGSKTAHSAQNYGGSGGDINREQKIRAAQAIETGR